MFNIIKSVFTRGTSQASGQSFEEEIPRYPPSAKGFPVTDIDKLVESQAELIQKLRMALGFTEEEHESLIAPVIKRYAEFVHLLPASESHHHRGAGGLFRHGLEVGFWVAQMSESVIYSMEGSSRERRNNEPRWRLASIFAGIMHDVGKPLSDVSVTDKDGTSTWNPYSGSLYEWTVKNKINRYYLRWRDGRHKRHERFSLLAVERIIPQKSLQYLSDAGPEIVEAMLEAIAGTGVNQPVTKLMLNADRISVAQDVQQSRLDVDEFSYGVPVERYVFDAIRRLVTSGKWKVNERGAKVWNLRNGVFIQWRNIGDLHDLIERDQIPGIPRDPDTLADILIERGFAIPNNVTTNGSSAKYRYWEICPAELQPGGDAEEVKILGLRLESSDLVFTNEPPPAVEGVIIGEAQEPIFEFKDIDSDQPDDTASDESGQEKADDDKGGADKAPATVTDIDNARKLLKETPADPVGDYDAMRLGDADELFGFDETEMAISAPELQEPGSFDPEDSEPEPANDKNENTVLTQLTESDYKETLTKNNVAVTEKAKPGSGSPQKLRNAKSRKEPKAPASKSKTAGILSKLSDATGTTGTTKELSPQERLDKKLANCSEQTKTAIKLIVEPVINDKADMDGELFMLQGRPAIRYPEGVRRCLDVLGLTKEDEKSFINALDEDGVVEEDHMIPGRKIQNAKGARGVVLSPGLAAIVSVAIRSRKKPVKQPPNAAKQAKLKASKPMSKKPAQPSNLEEGQKLPPQPGGRDKSAQEPKLKDTAAKNQAQHSSSTKSSSKNGESTQAQLNLYGGRGDDTKQQPIASARRRSVPPKEVTIQESEIDQARRVKAKSNAVDNKSILPSNMSASQCIEELIQMMHAKKGRWIVGQVREEDGHLVVTSQCLDVISIEYPELSKRKLRKVFTRNESGLTIIGKTLKLKI